MRRAGAAGDRRAVAEVPLVGLDGAIGVARAGLVNVTASGALPAVAEAWAWAIGNWFGTGVYRSRVMVESSTLARKMSPFGPVWMATLPPQSPLPNMATAPAAERVASHCLA